MVRENPNDRKKKFRENLDYPVNDVPDISRRGSPLEHVTQKENVDIEKVKRKRLGRE